MNATVVRKRTLSALVVGATGKNVLRVVTAFEKQRIITSRADDIASACECLVREMPHVVLSLVQPANEAERKKLADVTLAVGALLVHLDPRADDATFGQVLAHTVQTTLERRRAREEAEARTTGTSSTMPPPNLDDEWDR